MDKKWIIGSILGGLILFVCQALIWMVTNIHTVNLKYTDKQNEILAALSANLTEDGSYMLPTLPSTATQEEWSKFSQEISGKPWAQVSYHKSHKEDMGMNMFRGLIVNIFIIGLLIWFLRKIQPLNFKNVLIGCVVIGIIGYLNNYYLNSIWFQTNSIPHLIEALITWSATGAVLGWWLNRN